MTMEADLSLANWKVVGALLLIGCLSACGGGGGGGGGSTPTSPSGPSAQAFKVGGTVSGLTGSGLTLTMAVSNGANGTQSTQTVTVPAGANSFTFPTAIPLNIAGNYALYQIAVTTQPATANSVQSQTCVPLNAFGFVHTSSDVTNVQVTCVANPATAVQGVYQLYQNGAPSLRWLSLQPDGTYVFAVISNDPTCNNNGNGVDYGVYSWNAATGALQLKSAQVYSPAPCGVTNGSGVVDNNANVLTSTTGGSNSLLTLVVNGNTANAYTLVPVPSTPSSLVGAFALGGSLDQGLNIFTNDGHYVNINTQTDSFSGALAGIEYGCYTTANGTLHVDTTAACSGAVETAGSAGFSNGTATTTSFSYATPDANTLNLTIGTYALTSSRFAASSPAVTSASGGVTVGGTVTGLSAGGTALTLQLTAVDGTNNTASTQTIAVAPGSTSFTFPSGLAQSANTQVFVGVAAQPGGPSQTCVATNAVAELSASSNITSFNVSCIANPTSPLQGFYQLYSDAAGTQPLQKWLVFSPNGSFIFADIQNSGTCLENGDGIDYGAYTWNPTSGALTIQSASVYSLAPCGFTNASGAVDSSVTRTLTRTGTGSATVLTLVTNNGSGPTTAYALPAASTSGIVGAFAFGAGLDGGLIAFGTNGYYLLVNPQTDPGTGTGYLAGLEYGCYTTSGGTLTIDTTSSCPGAVYTAGGGGLSGGSAVTFPLTYALPFQDELQLVLGTYTFSYSRFNPN